MSAISTSDKSSLTFSLFTSFESPLPKSEYSTLPATVLDGIRLKCWKIIPIFFLAFLSSPALRSVKFLPSTNTFPVSGLSKRFIHLTSVDFPAPEKPIMPNISPFSITKDTSFTACTVFVPALKFFVTFFSSIIVSLFLFPMNLVGIIKHLQKNCKCFIKNYLSFPILHTPGFSKRSIG